MSSLDFLRACGDVNLLADSESRNASLGGLCGAVGQQRVWRVAALCEVVSWGVNCNFMLMDLL